MTKENKTWPKVRKFFNDVHLWLGLISGIIIFFVCLSGTIYVFNTELREMAASHLYKVENTNQTKLSPEELIAIVQKASGGKVSSVKVPFDQERSYVITAKKSEKKGEEHHEHGKEGKRREKESLKGEPSSLQHSHGKEERTGSGEKHNHGDHKEHGEKEKSEKGEKKGGERGGPGGGRGTQYMVNPYTGEVLGDSQSAKTFTSEFMQVMFSLHRWLLLDKVEEPIFGELENRKLGSYISGAATILFTLGVITGIVIWFPKKMRAWKQGFKIKWSGNWKRINHDLHNSLGLYSCVLLLLMGLTGPQWSFPWYREGLRKTLGTYQPEGAPRSEAPKSTIPAATINSSLNLTDYMVIADKHLAYEGDYTITLPTDSSSAISLTKNKKGFFAPAAADKVILDQYSGAVLEKEIFSEKPFNERVSNSIKALHIGDVYGMFSKILYFIACLIATSLPVTGTLIWINKLKKKRKRTLKTT